MSLKSSLLAAAAAGLVLAPSAAMAEPFISTGMASASIDAAGLVRDSIDEHTASALVSGRSDGGALWLDTAYQDNRSDRGLDGAGSRSRLFMASLGADIKKDDLYFGVAYSWGRGDTDSRGLETPVDGDTYYYGIKVFATQKFSALSVSGALGWMRLRGNGDTEGNAGARMHGDLFTGDLGFSLLLDCGAFSVMPYARAWLTVVNPENSTGFQPDNATLWQFPLGVRVSAPFSAWSWSFLPSLDISWVGNAGDKEITWTDGTSSYDSRYVDDHNYRASIGITASSGKGSFSLVYRYLGGSGGRESHGAWLDAKYTF